MIDIRIIKSMKLGSNACSLFCLVVLSRNLSYFDHKFLNPINELILVFKIPNA